MRDSQAADLLESIAEEERFATWHLARRDGTLVGYGTGGVELLRAMRITRPAARLLTRLPDGVLETAYRIIAGHRTRLGRLVRDRPGPHRFP